MPFDYALFETWGQRLLMIIVVVLSAVLLRWIVLRSIRAATDSAIRRASHHRQSNNRAEKILASVTGAAEERYQQRAETTASLLRNLTSVAIFTIAVLTIFAILDIPLGPLLATAGIGGIALGFGAQTVVKDFLSGIFMIMEDQYGVGDIINTGEVTGTVEEVGLRITRLRDAGGQVWYVRNGEIIRVGNQTQGWSTATADVPIGNDEDVTKALGVLHRVADEISADPDFAEVLLEPPTVVGVDSVTATGTILRIIAKTTPNQHWGVKRALLQRSLAALGAAGFHGPVVAAAPPPVPQV